MSDVKQTILVLSGKGGVGKSSIAANLAVWLSMKGKKVGLLDIDIHGPSIPKLLNLNSSHIFTDVDKIRPAKYNETLQVMSIGFLIRHESQAVIWRGPMKHNVIKQFVSQVKWGNLDYLIVDCPPGTGDEPLSIVQLIENTKGAVIVTTPQQLAIVDVKKCITFCIQLNLPVLGVIENMSGFVCPHCSGRIDMFGGNGGKQMAKDFNIPFLGSVPMDAGMVSSADSGRPFIQFDTHSPTAKILDTVFEPLLQHCSKPDKLNSQTKTKPKNDKEKNNKMRIAIPLTADALSSHFGHCEQFAIIDVDTGRNINHYELLEPPQHEPGVLPRWLAGLQVELVIAGGMGQRAQQLFEQNGIKVICGAPQAGPKKLVEQYLNNELEVGENICDH
jgi:ATP-binding protein involved in chromosome partitioning